MIPVGSHPNHAVGVRSGGAEPTMGPSLALTTVLETMHRMIQDVFATLQRENAHQRSLNEAMMRASTGHFDALAKSYERAFGDMKGRHDEALREANEHRAKRRSAEDDLASIADKYKEILDVKTSETVEAERRSKVTSFAAEQLKVLLPVILAKIAGVPVDGEAIGGAAAGQAHRFADGGAESRHPGRAATRAENRPLRDVPGASAERSYGQENGVPASPMAAGDVSASSSAHTPSPTQAPSPTALANSPSAVASPAASPGASFTPEEERDFERIMQWTESPKDQARYEAWLSTSSARPKRSTRRKRPSHRTHRQSTRTLPPCQRRLERHAPPTARQRDRTGRVFARPSGRLPDGVMVAPRPPRTSRNPFAAPGRSPEDSSGARSDSR